jgi:Ni/Fe-hydrogenase subunit HybB-like protein
MSGLLIVLTYLPTEIEAIYTSYFPSVIEILSGLGVIAYGVLAVTLGIRYLNLIDHFPEKEEVEDSAGQAVIAGTD